MTGTRRGGEPRDHFATQNQAQLIRKISTETDAGVIVWHQVFPNEWRSELWNRRLLIASHLQDERPKLIVLDPEQSPSRKVVRIIGSPLIGSGEVIYWLHMLIDQLHSLRPERPTPILDAPPADLQYAEIDRLLRLS